MRVLLMAVLVACSSSGSSDTADAGVRGDYDPVPFGGSRPTTLYVPSSYSDAKPAPLLVLLHGYGTSGLTQDLYLDLRKYAEQLGLLYVHPDGTVDSTGSRFWNATDACCNFDGSPVDDSSYLAGLVAEIGTRYVVDPKRVIFVGHSNGAFMSYRMACDHADLIAGIVSIAGDTWLDPTRCTPSAPVGVLQVQGTADKSVLYDGSTNLGGKGNGPYPGAKATVAQWAKYNGCDATPDTSAPPLDMDDSIPGPETTVTEYVGGCHANGDVELWTIQGAGHIPSFSANFDPSMLAWLLAHPKP
jgi:polyhydroxybutyrate depolymerase